MGVGIYLEVGGMARNEGNKGILRQKNTGSDDMVMRAHAEGDAVRGDGPLLGIEGVKEEVVYRAGPPLKITFMLTILVQVLLHESQQLSVTKTIYNFKLLSSGSFSMLRIYYPIVPKTTTCLKIRLQSENVFQI